jgi:OB-fold nucleic acid binding domain
MVAERCEIDATSESAASSQESDSEQDRGISLSERLTEDKKVVEMSLSEVVWVRAEISELRGKNGHLYPTLTERDDRGEILVQCKGIIWRNRAEPMTPKFVRATCKGPGAHWLASLAKVSPIITDRVVEGTVMVLNQSRLMRRVRFFTLLRQDGFRFPLFKLLPD